MLKYVFFIFLSFECLASESFYTLSFLHLENNIFSKLDKDISTHSDVLNLSYTQIFTQKHLFSISSFYAESKGNELRNGNMSKSSFYSRGFQEPQISYAYLAKSEKSDDGEVLNFKFSFIPSLFEKRSGGENPNQAIGGHFISYEAIWGQTYSTWAGYIRVMGARNFVAFEKNISSNTEYSKSAYSTYSLTFTGKYKFNNKWNLFFSSGIQFTRDIDIESNKTTSSALVQQGTGSTKDIGISYTTVNRSYSASIKSTKNQFFIDSGSGSTMGNYDGEFERYTFNLSVSYY